MNFETRHILLCDTTETITGSVPEPMEALDGAIAARDFGPICILLALSILSWFPRSAGPIDLRWDGGVYYVLGTSLAEHKGYRLLNEPGDILATQYPPLLPVLVSVHEWALGSTDPNLVGHYLRFSFFLIFDLYIVAVYFMSKQYLRPELAFVVALICVGNPFTQFLSDLLYPEILFALLLTLFVGCSNRSTEPTYGIAAGIFAAASYGVRTIGIAALLAWVADSIAKRKVRQAAVRALLVMIPIACWASYVSITESRQQSEGAAYKYQRDNYLMYNVSYRRNISLVDPFRPELGYAKSSAIVHRVLTNMAALPASIGEAVSSNKLFWEARLRFLNRKMGTAVFGPWAPLAILIFFSLLAIGGLVLQLFRRHWIVPFLIALSLVAMCATPWPVQFVRYLAPLLPFLALFIVQSTVAIRGQLSKIWGRTGKIAGSVFVVAIIGLIFLSETTTLVSVYRWWHQPVQYQGRDAKILSYKLFFYQDSYRVLDAGIDWLKQQAKPDDIIASSMPHWVFLRTGLKSVTPPFEVNPIQAQTLLDSVPVRFLIVDEGLAVDTRRYTLPVVKTFPGNWKRVYVSSVVTEFGELLTDQFAIYQRIQP